MQTKEKKIIVFLTIFPSGPDLLLFANTLKAELESTFYMKILSSADIRIRMEKKLQEQYQQGQTPFNVEDARFQSELRNEIRNEMKSQLKTNLNDIYGSFEQGKQPALFYCKHVFADTIPQNIKLILEASPDPTLIEFCAFTFLPSPPSSQLHLSASCGLPLSLSKLSCYLLSSQHRLSTPLPIFFSLLSNFLLHPSIVPLTPNLGIKVVMELDFFNENPKISSEIFEKILKFFLRFSQNLPLCTANEDQELAGIWDDHLDPGEQELAREVARRLCELVENKG